jgi:HSP20 family protein
MTNLIQWTPIKELERIFEDDFSFPVRMKAPAVDLYETENEVVAEVSIPGMDPKQVNVEIENNVLHIKSDEQEVREQKDKGYYKKEDKVTAHSEKGILRISMPKSEKAKPRKVNIEIKE